MEDRQALEVAVETGLGKDPIDDAAPSDLERPTLPEKSGPSMNPESLNLASLMEPGISCACAKLICMSRLPGTVQMTLPIRKTGRTGASGQSPSSLGPTLSSRQFQRPS